MLWPRYLFDLEYAMQTTSLSWLAGLTLSAGLCIAGGQAMAFGTQNDTNLPALHSAFHALDVNGDGRLSPDEARRDADLAQQFHRADSDHNGTLDNDEYATFKSPLQQARLKAYLDDSTITARVKAELLKDNGIKGLAISVHTYRGQVILSGFVDNAQQVRRALEITSGVRGVNDVKNSLLVKG